MDNLHSLTDQQLFDELCRAVDEYVRITENFSILLLRTKSYQDAKKKLDEITSEISRRRNIEGTTVMQNS